MSRLLRRTAVSLAIFFLVLPTHAQHSEYGSTEFENSGAESAQEPFLKGLLLLHSFEYVEARQAFQKAQDVDPDFAMAHWGEAMTHNHPVWMEQDRQAAINALRDLAPTAEKQLEAARTQREKDYVRALHTLYGVGREDPRPKETRDDAYAEAMADLAARYPDDLDAQAFHALSILGTAHEGRKFATYMRAAAIGEEVFDENPEHPGAAHYLIHAYDDPVHAPLGLRPARVYADIAPSASHALHMPSHIFFALGLWQRGGTSNVDSYEAARATTEARGEPLNGHGFHALHWLHYARLQQGRYEDARSVLQRTRAHADEEGVPGYAENMRWYMPVAYVVETERWDQLDDLLDVMKIEPSVLNTRGTVGVHVGRGMAAAQQEDVSTAADALNKAKSAIEGDTGDALRIQIKELEGLIALKRNRGGNAISHLKTATSIEADRPLEYGPPSPPKPAHELYGEILLALDRPIDALTQFEKALERYPGRSLSLKGKAKAAARAKRPGVAEEARAALEEQWANADDAVRSQLRSELRLDTRQTPDAK